MNIPNEKRQLLVEAEAIKALINSPHWKRSIGGFLKAEKERLQAEFYTSLDENSPTKQAKLSGQLFQLQQLTHYITGTIEQSLAIEDAIEAQQLTNTRRT